MFLPELNVMRLNAAAVGWTAFVGGTLFEVGSCLMILESLNRRHEVCLFPSIEVNSRFALETPFTRPFQNALMIFTFGPG